MAEHPRHPESDDAGHERGAATGSSWALYAFAFVAIVLVLGVVVLHLTGVVGPGAR